MASGMISFRRYLSRRHYQAGYPGSAGNGALVVRRASGATLPLARSRLSVRGGYDFPAATVTLPFLAWRYDRDLDGSNPRWGVRPHSVSVACDIPASSGTYDWAPRYAGGDCSSPAWFGNGFWQPFWGPRGPLPAGIPDGYGAPEGAWAYGTGTGAEAPGSPAADPGDWPRGGWGFGLWLYSAPRHRLHDPDGLVLRFEMDPGSATAAYYGVDFGPYSPASTYTPAWDDPEEAADYEALVAAIEAHGAANAAAAASAMADAWSSGYAALTLRGAARITDYRNFDHWN